MKLVNVEDLKVLVAVESKGEIRYGKLVTDLFDDIPTVKAIPVEWIKEWVERDENYWDYQYLTDVLLKDWEKENESTRSDI